ncbi:MAG: CBS domain-containing protein [Planctomycetes bacterium]|nr:CBS domain-containing protein [Planctomycetota bacterium]
MSVGRICVRDVDVARPDEPVQAIAARMHSRNVGALVVLNESKEPVGIVTDRDLVVKGMAQGLPLDANVEKVMTRSPHVAYEDTPIEDALRIMRSGGFRRIPVVNRSGELAGLVTLDDILDLLAEEFREIGGLLQKEGPRVLAKP